MGIPPSVMWPWFKKGPRDLLAKAMLKQEGRKKTNTVIGLKKHSSENKNTRWLVCLNSQKKENNETRPHKPFEAFHSSDVSDVRAPLADHLGDHRAAPHPDVRQLPAARHMKTPTAQDGAIMCHPFRCVSQWTQQVQIPAGPSTPETASLWHDLRQRWLRKKGTTR